ncbi:MAG: hypothetical protein ACOWWM_11725 [Desulfobacterales bacterium]
MSKQNMMQIVRDHKTMFVVIGVCLLLIEIEIFAIAAMKSGRKSTIQVLTPEGSVIYEADGSNLSQFDKYYFEQNFGPLDRYELRLATREVPFPFRAWFVAAFGIPIGAMLLFAFLVKAFLAVFYGESPETPPRADSPDDRNRRESTRLERLLLRLSRYNIFIIGFLILVGIFAYWVVPNLITHLGRVGIETLSRFKWGFLGLGAVVLGLLVWIIYLRFLLARKSLESQTELERYRLELEYRSGNRDEKLLTDGSPDRPLVEWTPPVGRPDPESRKDRPI